MERTVLAAQPSIRYVAMLMKIPLFQGCDPANLQAMVKELAPTTFRPREVIFKEGQPAEEVYCLLEGAAKLCKKLPPSGEKIISLAKPGDVLGLQAVMHEGYFTTTAVALQPTVGFFIPYQRLEALLRENPTLSLNILKTLCLDIDAIENKIAGLTQKNSLQRVAEVLIYLQEKFGTDEQGALRIHLNREELANLTHTTPGTLSRILAQLRREGVLAGKRQIVIRNAEQLARLAGLNP